MSSELRRKTDERGSLLAVDKLPPFTVRRFYLIDCHQGMVRGDHYHKNGKQMICLLDGSLCVEDASKEETTSFVMNPGDSYIQDTYHKFRFYSATSMSRLIVLSETEHDHSDYYTDWSNDELPLDDKQ